MRFKKFGTFCHQSGIFTAFSSIFVRSGERRRFRKSPYLMGIFWSGRRDLNPRPLVPQTSALTGLRHAPTENGADYRDVSARVKQGYHA